VVSKAFIPKLNLDIRSNRSSLEGVSFCFSQPCRDGKTNITVLRFSQEWLNRAPNQVLAARSQFNFGINAFDTTVVDIEPNHEFFSWLGQFQLVNRFNNDWLLLGRFYAQIAGDPLPIIEQFSLGGIETVRGYGQNELVTDNALLGSLELRIPLTQDPSVLQITPFIEGGTGWNNLLPNPDPATLGAVGLGLRWLVVDGLTVRLDYGIPLVSLDNRGNSLQEQGFYFSVKYQPFGR
jgi:hemolysin activation/secretion protein